MPILFKIRQNRVWWGRWDLNPGSPTPQAGILNQSSRRENQYTPQSEAIRRPQIPDEIRYKNEILKTIEKAIIEGKARNTVDAIRHRLIQLSRVADLINPDDVKKAIGYCKLSNV
jgi:hypothetical protein